MTGLSRLECVQLYQMAFLIEKRDKIRLFDWQLITNACLAVFWIFTLASDKNMGKVEYIFFSFWLLVSFFIFTNRLLTFLNKLEHRSVLSKEIRNIANQISGV